ncbi:hypothetical protein DIE18_03230 [Burkholderia sp. Bp9125]|nr:hypothetical protein DIE18_03230 [Burkholderia sp. Bp9125]
MTVIRKELRDLTTVDELRNFIADLPGDMPLCRTTNGHYSINKVGISGFVGELRLGREEEPAVVMRLGI